MLMNTSSHWPDLLSPAMRYLTTSIANIVSIRSIMTITTTTTTSCSSTGRGSVTTSCSVITSTNSNKLLLAPLSHIKTWHLASLQPHLCLHYPHPAPCSADSP